MNKQLRKAVIAGNWKMNKTPSETTALINEIKPLVQDADCDVVVCVPYVDLQAALEATKGTNIKVGAENCHWEKGGAYTGEISTGMLREMGVDYVIIGHSERRTYFGETDATVQKRVRAALDAGMTVILCVGETLEQREQGITNEVVGIQTKIALGGVSKEELSRIIIAYEPVWAIGTGRTATSEQANEVNHAIRMIIADLYDSAAADAFVMPLLQKLPSSAAADAGSIRNPRCAIPACRPAVRPTSSTAAPAPAPTAASGSVTVCRPAITVRSSCVRAWPLSILRAAPPAANASVPAPRG